MVGEFIVVSLVFVFEIILLCRDDTNVLLITQSPALITKGTQSAGAGFCGAGPVWLVWMPGVAAENYGWVSGLARRRVGFGFYCEPG